MATALLVLSVFFWFQLFGGLRDVVIGWGAHGAALVAAAVLVAAAPLVHRTIRLARPAVALASQVAGRIRFRLERRWRVQGILGLRHLPELADLDELALGILAGRLERIRLRPGTHVAAPPALAFVTTGHAMVTTTSLPVGIGPGATLRLDRSPGRLSSHRRCTVVLLPVAHLALEDLATTKSADRAAEDHRS